MTVHVSPEAGTREQILRLIIEKGPITSTELAEILVLTAAAVRRHLSTLELQGQITEFDGALSYALGRGRPPRRYVATDRGHAAFGAANADVATQALNFIVEALGPEGLRRFAHERSQEIKERYSAVIDNAGSDAEQRVLALAKALTQDGYATSVRRGPRGLTVQLCQGHCPIQDVASSFPILCEAETQAFGELLDIHVQRLATLAGGVHVCTLTIPLVKRLGGTSKTEEKE
ncbi:MAG: winged helix-turn-helix transcriptional regulator [Actinomycetaceae bacterium]|nr:winged helix-turn-helix transcriptional regulator [Actinomycetaceae bacterium]